MATSEGRPHGRDERAGVVVVRLANEDNARYAICKVVNVVDGDCRLPGSGQTVSELVQDQQLLAGRFGHDDDCGGITRAMAMQSVDALSMQSVDGVDITINIFR